MKKSVLYMLLVMLCFSCSKLFASHLSGGEITYECLGGNLYEISCKIYKDCSGSGSLAPTLTVHRNASACTNDEAYADEITLNLSDVAEVEAYCTGITTNCDDPSSPYSSFEVYTYTLVIQLPTTCSDWIFWISLNARNAGISNVEQVQQDFYIEAMLNNIAAPCNSSAVFGNEPIVFACVNQPFSYNHGVQEPDGDALSFVNTPPRTDVAFGDNTNMTYDGGYTFANPLTVAAGFNIDQVSGQMNFEPTIVQESVTAIKVVETRNGVVIGYVMRDIQLHCINCLNTQPVATGFNGGGVNQTTISMQPGDSICATITGFDPDVGDSIEMVWDGGILGATFTVDYSGPQAVGTFCWRAQPENCNPVNGFIVEIRDNNCPVRGRSSYGFNVIVPVYFCRDSVYFTNRNHTNGQTVPNGDTRASSFIKAGYNVPEAGVPLGDVVIRDGQNVTFIAGDNITGVVGFNQAAGFVVEAGATFYAYIQSTPCEAECSPPPLTLKCIEDVQCPSETVIARANHGFPPYQYSWKVDGVYAGSDSVVDLHYLVQLDDSTHTWEVTVSDRLGDVRYCTEEFCGRTVLYHTNLDTIDYFFTNVVSNSFPTDVFMFFETHPDSVTAPYYKANRYRFQVWDSWGELIHFDSASLGQTRLSFYNGEIHWDGRANLFNDDCVPFGEYIWRVDMWNCIGTYKEVQGYVHVAGCWDGNIEDYWYGAPPPCGDGKSSVFPDSYKIPEAGNWNTRLGQRVPIKPDDEDSEHYIQVHPNPSNGNVVISIVGGERDGDIAVFNTAGQMVHSEQFNGTRHRLDLSEVPKGLYSVQLRTGNSSYIKNVLIQ